MRHVIADETADVVIQRQGHDEHHADDRRDQSSCAAEETLAGVPADDSVQHQRDDFHRAAGSAIKQTLLCRVAEAGDLWAVR